MSSEQNVPEVYSAPAPPPPAATSDPSNGTGGGAGAGQSKSSRRRRRKRKNKGGPDGGAGANGAPRGESNGGGSAEEGSVPAIQASSPAPQGGNGANGQATATGFAQTNSNGAASGKRWKKKFRDRERGGGRREENPGNVASPGNGGGSGGGGFREHRQGSGGTDTHQVGNRADGWKRKSSSGGGKQGRDRGPRSFVGPMDHSYRSVSGTFQETSPSTMDHGNHGRSNGHARSFHSSGDQQPIDYSQGKPVPIPDDAPTKIVFFIDDLFFVAKISETARKMGVKVAFLKNEKEPLAELLASEGEGRPSLIVVDLNNANAKPLTLIPKIKAKLKRGTSVVGFLSQMQGELRAKAVEAGCDTVMARAAFSQGLPNLLRRYGLEEEEENNNFNF